MPKYQLHYQNQTFELSLFDDFYITIDDSRLDTNDELAYDMEAILATLHEGSTNPEKMIQNWMDKTGLFFNIFKDDVKIEPSTVRHDMIDNLVN
jgi:hypothetical protein